MFKDNSILIEMKKGVCFVYYKNGPVDKESAIKNIKTRLNLTRKHGRLNIVCFIGKKTKFKKQARKQFGMVRGYIGIDNIAIVMKKNRFVIDLLNLFSPNKRIKGKPLTKFFNNEENAISWIGSQKLKKK